MKIQKLTRSELAEAVFYLNGERFSLRDYPHMRPIYNIKAKTLVLQFSRQTSKSTTLANLIITNSIMMGGFKPLFVAPSADQAKVFSHDRVKPVLLESPWVRRNFMSTYLLQNVFSKELTNGSKIFIRYGNKYTVDRIRGISADMNLFDEVQDMDIEVIPVVRQTMQRSTYKRSIYAGTPKRTQGTLANLFHRSTRHEWQPLCTHCNHRNYLDEANIAETKLICRYCGKPLDPKLGTWISTNPEGEYPGFRVSALQFFGAPWIDWKEDIINFRRNNPPALFYNEVLGLEYDDGVAPITEAEIRACCCDKTMAEMCHEMVGGIGGLDYGPVNSNKSHTVFIVLYYDNVNDKIIVPYAKKYLGKEADYKFIHTDIPATYDRFNLRLIGADYGLGEASNAEIRGRIGYNKLQAFYHSGTQKQEISWNAKLQAYILNKTVALTKFFDLIKKKRVIFPKWEEFKPYAQDLLNVQIEFDVDKNQTKFFNIGPDDITHALVFANYLEQLSRKPTFLGA